MQYLVTTGDHTEIAWYPTEEKALAYGKLMASMGKRIRVWVLAFHVDPPEPVVRPAD